MSDTPGDADALRRALGAEIRSWRSRRKMSRLEVARLVGISETTMGRIERDGPVDVADTWRIADVLDIDFSDLVRRAEDAVAIARAEGKHEARGDLPPDERELLMDAISDDPEGGLTARLPTVADRRRERRSKMSEPQQRAARDEDADKS